MLNFSEAVRRRQPFTALNHMSRMPNFEAGYHKFTFKNARQEADLGCRSFDEPGPTPFTREDVSKFDLVDQRTMLALTGSRLLHNCHPRQVNTLAKMTSLHNAVKCLPGQEHRQANRLGDGYSKLESMKLMEGATASFDSPIVALKKGVESLTMIVLEQVCFLCPGSESTCRSTPCQRLLLSGRQRWIGRYHSYFLQKVCQH